MLTITIIDRGIEVLDASNLRSYLVEYGITGEVIVSIDKRYLKTFLEYMRSLQFSCDESLKEDLKKYAVILGRDITNHYWRFRPSKDMIIKALADECDLATLVSMPVIVEHKYEGKLEPIKEYKLDSTAQRNNNCGFYCLLMAYYINNGRDYKEADKMARDESWAAATKRSGTMPDVDDLSEYFKGRLVIGKSLHYSESRTVSGILFRRNLHFSAGVFLEDGNFLLFDSLKSRIQVFKQTCVRYLGDELYEIKF